MAGCYEYCVLSGRGLCDELITRTEESYRVWCVVVCPLETWRLLRQKKERNKERNKEKKPELLGGGNNNS